MFRTHAPLALLVSFASLSTGVSAPKEINGIAAIVNGRPITKSEVAETAKATRGMIQMTVPPGTERNKKLSTVEEDALNSLIERELILAEFKKSGFIIKDQLVDEDVNKIIAGERFGGDRAKFLSELKTSNMTLKRFKDLRRKLIAVEMMSARNSGGPKIVTPQQVNAAYAEHGDRFRGEGFVRLRTLMIPKLSGVEGVSTEDQRKLVDTIRRKIVTRTDTFEQMAKTYSKDSVADIGGDRGTIGANSKDLRPDLVMNAMRLGSGEVSPVLDYDPYAFWLLKAENKKLGAKKPLSDPEVYKVCERLAQSDLRKEARERWVTKLKRSASIRRFDGGQVTSIAPAKPREITYVTPGTLPPKPPAEKKKLIERILPTGRDADAAAQPEPVQEPKKKKLLERLRPFKKG